MFYDDQPKKLQWDYFLTDYERDLLTLTLEEVVRKNPNKPLNEVKAEIDEIENNQANFKGFGLPKEPARASLKRI